MALRVRVPCTRFLSARQCYVLGQAHLWLVYRFFIVLDISVPICHIDVRDFACARRLFWLERATLGLALIRL